MLQLLQHLSIIQVMLTLQIIILLVLVAQNHRRAKLLESIDQSLKCLPAVKNERASRSAIANRAA